MSKRSPPIAVSATAIADLVDNQIVLGDAAGAVDQDATLAWNGTSLAVGSATIVGTAPIQATLSGTPVATTAGTPVVVAYSSGAADAFVGRNVTNNLEVMLGPGNTQGSVGTTTSHIFSLVTNNSTRAFVPAAGGFAVGTGGAALATTATDGFLYIPTCAGTPTGVPNAPTGTVALVFDTTNNKLYVYDGSWLGGTAPGAFT